MQSRWYRAEQWNSLTCTIFAIKNGMAFAEKLLRNADILYKKKLLNLYFTTLTMDLQNRLFRSSVPKKVTLSILSPLEQGLVSPHISGEHLNTQGMTAIIFFPKQLSATVIFFFLFYTTVPKKKKFQISTANWHLTNQSRVWKNSKMAVKTPICF